METGNKEFTKADLKDGMVVEYRNGERYVVLDDRLINNTGYDLIDSFGECLEDNSKNTRFVNDNYDITKVYKINAKNVYILNDIFKECNLELIWERKEAKKMTVEEMKQKLEELTGEKIEVSVNRDEMIRELNEFCKKKSCGNCFNDGTDGCIFENLGDTRLENVYEKYKKFLEENEDE